MKTTIIAFERHYGLNMYTINKLVLKNHNLLFTTILSFLTLAKRYCSFQFPHQLCHFEPKFVIWLQNGAIDVDIAVTICDKIKNGRKYIVLFVISSDWLLLQSNVAMCQKVATPVVTPMCHMQAIVMIFSHLFKKCIHKIAKKHKMKVRFEPCSKLSRSTFIIHWRCQMLWRLSVGIKQQNTAHRPRNAL